MARNLHPEQAQTERLLQRNFRALEALLDGLIDTGGDLEAFLLGGRPGGQVANGGDSSGEDMTLSSNPSGDGDITIGGVLAVDEGAGVVDIGSSDRDVRLDVRDTTVNGDPAGSGTAQPHGILRLRGAGATVLDIGQNASLARCWIQACSAVALGTVRKLAINPMGGDVGIGINPSTPFDAMGALRVDANPMINAVRAGASGVAFFSAGSFGSGVGVVFLGNSTTSPSSPPLNGVLFEADDVNSKSELFVYNEAGERARLTGRRSVTTSDFTKTADVTLADIPGISRYLEAGKTYLFTIRLFDVSDSTGGYALQLNGTATATYIRAHWRRHPVSSSAFSMSSTVTSLGHPSVGEGSPSVASGYIECCGTIVVSTAGTLTAKFAQNSATGASSIKRGSTIEIEEI